jgi:hypothetical protein
VHNLTEEEARFLVISAPSHHRDRLESDAQP